MRINWGKAVVAGIVGTLVFDLIGFALTQQWWDIPLMLGGKLGVGLFGGVVAHYINGMLIATIFAGVGPSLWGPTWARALLFMTAQTVFGVGMFMMPLLGMGFMGLAGGIMTPVVGMIRHWGFGLVLAFLYPLPEDVLQAVETTRDTTEAI